MSTVYGEDYRGLVEQLCAENPFIPLHGVVRDILREKIISCHFPPGQALRELTLAEEFGVSRTTVRNALDALEQEGLLVKEGRSLYVAPLTRPQYDQLHQFRWHLDPIAAGMAAANCTPGDLRQIAKALEEGTEDDSTAFLKADCKFHRAIYVATHNQYILAAYEKVDPARTRINYFSVVCLQQDSLWGFGRNKRERMREEHQSIFRAIEQSDEQLAAELARKHVGLRLFDFDAYERRSLGKEEKGEDVSGRAQRPEE